MLQYIYAWGLSRVQEIVIVIVKLYERNFNVVVVISSTALAAPTHRAEKGGLNRGTQPTKTLTKTEHHSPESLKSSQSQIKLVVELASVYGGGEARYRDKEFIHYDAANALVQPCKTSFLSRRTGLGPSSGSIHGYPLVARSGSVVGRKIARPRNVLNGRLWACQRRGP